jgi:hypothetical protein
MKNKREDGKRNFPITILCSPQSPSKKSTNSQFNWRIIFMTFTLPTHVNVISMSHFVLFPMWITHCVSFYVGFAQSTNRWLSDLQSCHIVGDRLMVTHVLFIFLFFSTCEIYVTKKRDSQGFGLWIENLETLIFEFKRRLRRT